MIFNAWILHRFTWVLVNPWAIFSANDAAWAALSSLGARIAKTRAWVNAWVCVIALDSQIYPKGQTMLTFGSGRI